MARSKITSASKDLISDDGAVLVSVIKGEQIHLNLTLSWLTNISNYEIFSKVVEANNDGAGTIPESAKIQRASHIHAKPNSADRAAKQQRWVPPAPGAAWGFRSASSRYSPLAIGSASGHQARRAWADQQARYSAAVQQVPSCRLLSMMAMQPR